MNRKPPGGQRGLGALGLLAFNQGRAPSALGKGALREPWLRFGLAERAPPLAPHNGSLSPRHLVRGARVTHMV